MSVLVKLVMVHSERGGSNCDSNMKMVVLIAMQAMVIVITKCTGDGGDGDINVQ